MTTSNLKDERAAFEAWARHAGYSLEMTPGANTDWSYLSLETCRALEGWKARATQASEVEQAPVIPRDFLGELVRDAWVKWAKQQPNPKPSWLAPYWELDEVDKEADRQIGEAVWNWAFRIKGALLAPAKASEVEQAPLTVRSGDLTVTDVPARIYLNLGDIYALPETEMTFQSLTDVTWCEDMIDDGDIQYVRADIARATQASEVEQTCPKCKGSGVADSGGTMPWGEPAMVQCDCESEAALPAWFDAFLTNVCEIPDRNSPDDEPEAIVATLEELEACALNAIESIEPDDSTRICFFCGEPMKGKHEADCPQASKVKQAPTFEALHQRSTYKDTPTGDARIRCAKEFYRMFHVAPTAKASEVEQAPADPFAEWRFQRTGGLYGQIRIFAKTRRTDFVLDVDSTGDGVYQILYHIAATMIGEKP